MEARTAGSRNRCSIGENSSGVVRASARRTVIGEDRRFRLPFEPRCPSTDEECPTIHAGRSDPIFLTWRLHGSLPAVAARS